MIRLLLLLLLAGACVRAQEPAPPARPETPAETYQRLDQAYQAAYDAWNLKRRDALRANDLKLADALQKDDPTRVFCPQFEAAAQAVTGTDDAVSFLLWVVSHGRYGVGRAREALATLIEKHVGHGGLKSVPLCVMLMVDREGYDRATALDLLDRLIDHSPHAAVQAHAGFYRAVIVLSTPNTEAERARAKKDLVLAGAMAAKAGDRYLSDRVPGYLFELEHLQVGMAAPDIEGEDLDGRSFKLSDFRGRVVLLDFWGHW